jgi:hypothetical protein
MTETNGTTVLIDGYPATIVANRPELGGWVVAMTGEGGTTPGEQFILAPSGTVSQALFEACTSERHQVDLTLPKTQSPSAAERATWRKAA